MYTQRLKNSGFTLTELMVVIVILCCLATWVPFAWLVPDKPKDLKSIEHLRAHAAMHQAYFSMNNTYPNIISGDPTYEAYARLVMDKNPAISTRLFIANNITNPAVANHNIQLFEGSNGNLNQLTLDTDSDPNTFVPVLVETPGGDDDAALREVWEMDACQKNSPIDLGQTTVGADPATAPTEENNNFCELDSQSTGTTSESFNFAYRTITVGPSNPSEVPGTPAMFLTINGQDVMIPHRCLGVVAPSGTIYLVHIAGGDTLSTSHIPGSNTAKVITSGNAAINSLPKLLGHVLFACQLASGEINGTLDPSISLLPGF